MKANAAERVSTKRLAEVHFSASLFIYGRIVIAVVLAVLLVGSQRFFKSSLKRSVINYDKKSLQLSLYTFYIEECF
jgi:ABC-type uncharacterized transport system permease subunit